MPRVLTIIALLVLAHLAFTGNRLAAQLWAIDGFGSTPATNGTLMACFGLLPALFSVSAGRVVDRIGFRRPVIVGLVCELIGLALVPAFPSLVMLHIAALFAGSGFMLCQIALQNALGHVGLPENRAVNFSWMGLGFSGSMLVAPLSTGVLIDTIGHRFTFVLLAAIVLIPLAAMLLGRVALPTLPPAVDIGKRRLVDLFRHQKMRNLFIVTGLTSIAWDLFMFVMPIYGTSIGLSATRIGVVIGSFALATFTVRLVLPMLIRRVPLWWMLAGALAITGSVYTLIPLTDSVPTLMTLAFVLGLGLGSTQPMIMALLHTITPNGRVGEALGLRTTVINASQTALPLFFGAVGAAMGMLPVFWLLASVMLGGAVLAGKQGRAEAKERI
ncbi:MAG: MFS transporter [Burkholderiales bacterium]